MAIAAAPVRPAPKRRLRLPPPWALATSLLFAALCVLNSCRGLGHPDSLKAEPDLFRYPPTIFDFTPTAQNYERVVASGFSATCR